MMALQRFDEGGRRIRLATYRREKYFTICALYNHTLVFIQQSPRALERKIAGGESGHRHGLLDHSLCRWRYAKFESLGLVLSFRRRRFFSRCRHDQSPTSSLSDLTPHSLILLGFSSFLINKKCNNISMLRVS